MFIFNQQNYRLYQSGKQLTLTVQLTAFLAIAEYLLFLEMVK